MFLFFSCFLLTTYTALSAAIAEYPSDWDVIFTNASSVPASYPFGQEDIFLARNTTSAPSQRPLPCDVLKQRDVPITLRDNTVIYADVFLPANSSEKHFPALVNFSPYGKSTPATFVASGVSPAWVSGYEKFEGADVAAYTCRGYAVVNPDNRGAYRSEGKIHFWGSVDAQDGYDVIEWIAEQSWSTGKVATIGASWLAITQWFVAALSPPHLSAIVPWDGFSDYYRDNVMWGGFPNLGITASITTALIGGSKVERPDLMTGTHPYMDAYWEDKSVALEKIKVPAYVVADNIMPLHTKGALEGYRRISSTEKWLRIDDTQEWNDMYNPLWQEDALQFLDYFLKGSDNGWELTPRVRAAVTDAGGSNRRLSANEWPIEHTEYRKLHLDAARHTLSTHPLSLEAEASYHARTGNTTFVTTFAQDMQLIGYFSAHLFVEASGADDMDLSLTLEKLDQDGNLLENVPACTVDLQSQCLVAAGSTRGTQARLRVSLRDLDHKKSTSFFPIQSFKSPRKLCAGEVVAIDVAFIPNAYYFHAGQQLRLVVQGADSGSNNGSHIVHTGGKYGSYVQIPVVPV
ncbi:CocE/NonD family hydrolase [Aspergillus foveolatus]|uniref:CocE/NonD family hydrolase n=1 Tax=Aspergillus foveolatus TaxID=210207 RepID=UPI003CCE24C8